jgi:hypothetical protein
MTAGAAGGRSRSGREGAEDFSGVPLLGTAAITSYSIAAWRMIPTG